MTQIQHRRGFMKKGVGLSNNLGLITPSMAVYLRKEEEEKERVKLIARAKQRNKRRCEDCLFWKQDHCGLYSANCVNSPSRPSFLPKGVIE